jgi:hypothetical protein
VNEHSSWTIKEAKLLVLIKRAHDDDDADDSKGWQKNEMARVTVN